MARACLPALLVLLAELAAALFVGFGLAGRRGIDAGRHDFHGQGDDVDGGLGDGADDAAGQQERAYKDRNVFMAGSLAEAA